MTTHRRSLPFTKRLEIAEFLKDKVKKIEEGYCEYLPPWTDILVAKELGVGPNNVAGVRTQVIGRLKDSPIAWQSARIDGIEATLKHTEAHLNHLDALYARIDALEAALKHMEEHLVARFGYRRKNHD